MKLLKTNIYIYYLIVVTQYSSCSSFIVVTQYRLFNSSGTVCLSQQTVAEIKDRNIKHTNLYIF